MKDLLIGNDVGNSEQKIYINNDYINQPSCYSKILKMPNLEEVSSKGILNDLYNNIMVTINSPCCQSGTYYTGKRALQSGLALYNMDVTDKKNISDVYYINTLATIGAYAVKKNGIKTDDVINVNINMACSLPVSQYNKQEGEIVKNRLKGKHNVTVHLGEKRIDVAINFNYIKVLPESVSIMFALREIEEENFDDKKILHVSIGEGTTEYPLTEGIKFKPDYIKGSNNGIGHAIEKAIDGFKDQLGLRTYTRQLYSDLLQTNHKFTHIAKDFLQEHLITEAEDILRYVKREIQRANGNIDYVIVHGGGSILLRNHIESNLVKLCKSLNIKLYFVNENNAVNLEAQGLYIFANSEIFETLKEKATN